MAVKRILFQSAQCHYCKNQDAFHFVDVDMYWPGDFDINLIPSAGRIDQHHGQDSNPASQGQLFRGFIFNNIFAGFF